MSLSSLFRKNKKIIKFSVSGSTVAVIEFGLLFYLTEKIGLWYLLSAGISFSTAFFVSFLLQKFWTFKDYCRERIYKQLSMYMMVGLVNLCLNQLLLFISVEFLHVWYFFAQIVIAGVLGVGSFVLYKFFIFRKIDDSCGDNKHILIASGIFPPDLGGPATFASILAEGLADAGNKVRVIIFGDNKIHSDSYRISRVNRQTNKFMRYAKYFLKLWRFANQSDVIYAMDMISVGLPSAIVKLLDRRIKFFVRLGGDHQWESSLGEKGIDCSMEEYYERKEFSSKEKMVSMINNFVLSRADKVVFNSEYLMNLVIKYRGLNPDKAVVIKNITPTEVVEQVKRHEETVKRIIFAGRLTKVKNLPRLLQAFDIASKSGSCSLELRLIGDGPEKDALSQLIEKSGLSGSIKMAGRMSREELLRTMNEADVIAIPSLTEFNSNVASEGLALGKKVLITNKSEHFYIQDRNPNIYYVDPTDVQDIARQIIAACCSSGQIVGKPVTNGESWDISRVINEHIKIFNS